MSDDIDELDSPDGFDEAMRSPSDPNLIYIYWICPMCGGEFDSNGDCPDYHDNDEIKTYLAAGGKNKSIRKVSQNNEHQTTQAATPREDDYLRLLQGEVS